MKKIILLLAISFSLLAMSSCGSDDKNDKKDKDSKELSAADVPDPVKSAFSAKYSTATDVTWKDAMEDTKKTYKAKFTMDGKKWKAEFDAGGAVIKEKEND